MKTYKSISDIKKEAEAKGWLNLFEKTLFIAIEEEKKHLQEQGQSIDEAEEIAKQDILNWINWIIKDEELINNDSIKFEALDYYRISFILTLALRQVLEKPKGKKIPDRLSKAIILLRAN